MVIIVTFVLEDHLFREYAESVGESPRDKHHPVVLVGKLDRKVPSIGRRTLTEIYGDIKDTAFDHTHKFRLGIWRMLEMEASYNSI